MGVAISDICVARHSRDPIVPSSHNLSARSHPGIANRLIMALVISMGVTVPSKSMDIKNLLFMVIVYYNKSHMPKIGH